MSVGGIAPDIGESRRLRPHDDGRALPHVGIIIEVRVLQLCREDAYAFGFEEGDAVF